ncbi:hypothetical protein D7Z26_06195 [Cohnella endophytica]|uniref:Uncharacterized protein n=1 Tax=Cohnella endophytica TaxID=2419778 RepID=A0A494Y0E1_9BACL|nr:hypothetical protein [Cohnella endophytica]RKP56227.1 hypothetical protein D7Z26_06195 [Cohnella endophytica]
MEEEEIIWKQFIQLERKKIQPDDPDGEPRTELELDWPPDASDEVANVEKGMFAGSQTAANTESITDEEEISWRKFIQDELNKIQLKDADKSSIRAIAPELVQIVFRHTASSLLTRLRKLIEPSKDETSIESRHDKEVKRNAPLRLRDRSNRSMKRSDSGEYARRRRRKEAVKRSVKRGPKPILRRVVRDLKKSAAKPSNKKTIVRSKSSQTRQKSIPVKASNKKTIVRSKSSIRTRLKSIPVKASNKKIIVRVQRNRARQKSMPAKPKIFIR